MLAVLNRHKGYPSAARWRREEGIAPLRFSMRCDGTVTAWRIERSSGSQDLDGAVEQMIRRASPLPAPPDELPGDPSRSPCRSASRYANNSARQTGDFDVNTIPQEHG